MDNGEIIGVIPIVTANKYFLQLAASPIRHILTPYVGIAWKDKLDMCLRGFCRFCRDNRIHIGSVTFSSEEADAFAGAMNLESRAFYETIIRLDRPAKSIMDGMKARARTNIRKSERHQFTIHEDYDETVMREYAGIRETMHQQQGMGDSRNNSFFSEIFGAFEKPTIRLFTLHHNSRVIAGAAYVAFRDTVYYWDGASDRRYANLSPCYALHWHSMNWARRNHYRIYNMGGTNTPSIAFFKEGFGGEPIRYVSLLKSSSSFSSYLWKGVKQYVSRRNPKLNRKPPAPTRIVS